MHYLTAGEVMMINEVEIGPDLLADFGLLEAAVLRPQQSAFGSDAYPDIHTKAAAMLYSLILAIIPSSTGTNCSPVHDRLL